MDSKEIIMKEIVSTQLYENYNSNWKNEVTDFLNQYLKVPYKKCLRDGYNRGTYIMFSRSDGAAIRFPGATRGSIWWDENHIITKIEIYGDECYDGNLEVIYKKEVHKLLDQFIGCKMVIPEESRC
jgi:hypothetical protein